MYPHPRSSTALAGAELAASPKGRLSRAAPPPPAPQARPGTPPCVPTPLSTPTSVAATPCLCPRVPCRVCMARLALHWLGKSAKKT